MSQDPSFFRATVTPLAIAGAMLAAAALAGCGREGETNAAASASAASASAAAASPAATAPSASAPMASAASATTASNAAEPPLAPTAPECPKVAAPKCPAPAATHRLALPRRVAALWSAPRHHHRVHHRRWERRDEPIDAAADRGARFDGYRLEDRTREIVRVEPPRGYGWDHPVAPACRGCCDAHYDGRRIYREAGIDECGFLVWPGKVEY